MTEPYGAARIIHAQFLALTDIFASGAEGTQYLTGYSKPLPPRTPMASWASRTAGSPYLHAVALKYFSESWAWK
jgi:hypothetical protein